MLPVNVILGVVGVVVVDDKFDVVHIWLGVRRFVGSSIQLRDSKMENFECFSDFQVMDFYFSVEEREMRWLIIEQSSSRWWGVGKMRVVTFHTQI